MRPCERVPELIQAINACRVCAAQMAHVPRPIVQFSASSRLVIIGQAPGARVHATGIPWDDASGARLREWTGIPKALFYDSSRIALVPMGFCYPGLGKSGDLPPRPECAPLWHERVLRLLPQERLTLLVGSYAQARYLTGRERRSMTHDVRAQPGAGDNVLALPHPSWRSSIWMRQNPWFEAEILPRVRAEIKRSLLSMQ